MYSSSLTLQQTRILDQPTKSGWWLFEIVENGTTHYWSPFSSKVFGGHTYTFKITNFSEIQMRANGSEYGLIAPNEVTIRLTNKGNILDPADYEGAEVTIRLVMSANLGYARGAGESWSLSSGISINATSVQEAEIRSWGFEVIRAENINQELVLYCRSWLDKYLQGDWPSTPLIGDIFPSSDPKAEKSNACVPVIYGAAYIPLESAFITNERYYILGTNTPTYTINEVKSPKEWGSKSTWASPTYTFTQSTKTGRDGNSYKVVQPIIADANGDGTADANGLFLNGERFLPIPCKYSSSATSTYRNPASVIYLILQDMGVPSIKINTASMNEASVIFTNWGILFDGGWWYKRNRREILAELLTQCHMGIIVRDQLYFRVKTKVSQLTLSKQPIILSGNKDTYTSRRLSTEDLKDSCYVAYVPTGEPEDRLVKIVVPAKTTTATPANETYNMPLVHNSQHVQKLGTLAAQRVYLQHSEVSFTSMFRMLQIEVDDIVTIEPTNYNGPLNILITAMGIMPDGQIHFRGIRFKNTLDDWDDLAPGAITVATDTSTNTYQIVTCGPDSGANILPGPIQVSENGVLKTCTSPSTSGGMLINNTSMTGYNTAGAIRFQAIYAGADQGDVTIGDYSGAQGVKWDQSAGKIDIKGRFTAIEGTIGGFTIGPSTLVGGTTNIVLDATNKAISINSATYGNSGIQLQYNAGIPRFYVGDGSTKYCKWTGSALELSVGTIKEFQQEIFTSGSIKTNAAPATNGGFLLDSAKMVGYIAGGGERFRVDLSGTDAGDVIIGDYTNNKGLKWDQSAATFAVRGSLNADDITSGLLTARTMQTKGSQLTQATNAGDSTIYVADTTDFPSSGVGWISDTTVDEFTYTGKTGTTLTGCSGVLTHSAGLPVGGQFKRMILSALDNEMHFFGDRGDGTIVELASIGIKVDGSDTIIGYFGKSSGSSRVGVAGVSDSYHGVFGWSNSSHGVHGYSESDVAVYGNSPTNIGVYGRSVSDTGVWGDGYYGGYFSGALSPICLDPSISASVPTHSAKIGSLWVTSAGVLYINISSPSPGTTWQKVGAQ